MHFRSSEAVRLLLAAIVIAGAVVVSSGVASAQPAAERGKYLVTAMDCHGCHTPFKMGQPDMTRMLSGHPQDLKITAAPVLPAGGVWGLMASETNTAWAGPWGVSFTPNLTPDRTTGLGAWTDEMFVKAIRTGRHLGAAGGREILPPMPWASYAGLTDADLKAIFAYLKTIPAVANRVPAPIAPVRK
jgi:hypothetical protein